MTQATRDDPPDARPTDFYVNVPNGVAELGPLALATYHALGRRMNNETRQCWPSHSTLAEMAGVSVNTIKRSLRLLKANGWIDWRPRMAPDGKRHQSNMYYVYQSASQNPRPERPTPRPVVTNPPGPERATPGPERPTELLTSELVPTEEQTSQPSRDDDPTPDVAHLVAVMSESLTRLGVKHKPTTEWARTFRLMIDLDERTPAQIEGAIRWAHADDFWAANIHSPRKLRKQFDQLRIQAARPNRKSTNQQNIELIGQLADQPEGTNPWLLSPSA